MPAGTAGTAPARRGRLRVIAILLVAAAALFAAVVELSTEEGGEPKIEIAGINDAQRLFGGIPQEGNRLGSADAPVTVQVFNDLGCDDCSEQFLATIPSLAEGPVRDGDVKLLYRHYSFSVRPVQEGFIAAEAAGEQGYLWPYVYLFFASQDEAERVGAGAEFLEAVAAGITELEVAEWKDAYAEGGGPGGGITRRLEEEDRVARDLGLRAEPSAIVSGPGGTVELQDSPTLAEIEAAIAEVG